MKTTALALLTFLLASLPSAQATPDDKFFAELKDHSLRQVVDALCKGVLDAPSFCLEKQAPKDGGKLCRAFVEKVRLDREASLRDAAKTDAYAMLLADFYNYLNKFDSYSALLLQDCLKRLVLEWASVKLRTASTSQSRKEIDVMLGQFKLEPSRLKLLFGREAKPEWIRGSSDINETSQQFAESHGFHATAARRSATMLVSEKQMMGDAAMMKDALSSMSAFLSNYKPLAFGMKMLESEFERFIALGTLEFLNRGGDVSKATPKDVRYFYHIMSEDTCAKFGFQPLGGGFTETDMLQFLGLLRLTSVLGPELFWLRGVFE